MSVHAARRDRYITVYAVLGTQALVFLYTATHFTTQSSHNQVNLNDTFHDGHISHRDEMVLLWLLTFHDKAKCTSPVQCTMYSTKGWQTDKTYS
ncbi:hypothetical protein J6590_072381 [Homalodisca vitripennis]|nr:hypothetical protein J6590_072381 [Homalodisca vitripennis]